MSDEISLSEFDEIVGTSEMPSETQGPEEDWSETGEKLANKHKARSLQFDVGDWLEQGIALAEKHDMATVSWNFGEWFLRCALPDDIPGVPKPYDAAEDITGLSRATLYDWASTCKRIPASIRTEKLPYSHHRAVANALPDADDATKTKWLDLAVEEQLNTKQLQERLRVYKNPHPIVGFIVKLPDTLVEMLRSFAKDRNVTVNVVAAEFLTEYLERDEVQAMAKAAARNIKKRTKERRRAAAMRTDNLRLLR